MKQLLARLAVLAAIATALPAFANDVSSDRHFATNAAQASTTASTQATEPSKAPCACSCRMAAVDHAKMHPVR